MEIHAPADGRPCVITVVGPNGIGKSTFYSQYLSHLGWPYVNADALARAFWEDHLLEDNGRKVRDHAAAVMTDKLRDLLLSDGDLRVVCHSFVSETVFSSERKVEFLRRVKAAGYHQILVALGTDEPDLLKLRVSQRKIEGGHGVDGDVIVERYSRVFGNVQAALSIVDVAHLLDNSSLDNPFLEVARLTGGKIEKCIDGSLPRWANVAIGERA